MWAAKPPSERGEISEYGKHELWKIAREIEAAGNDLPLGMVEKALAVSCMAMMQTNDPALVHDGKTALLRLHSRKARAKRLDEQMKTAVANMKRRERNSIRARKNREDKARERRGEDWQKDHTKGIVFPK